MLTIDFEHEKSKYGLTKLRFVEDLVASAIEVTVPFNDTEGDGAQNEAGKAKT